MSFLGKLRQGEYERGEERGGGGEEEEIKKKEEDKDLKVLGHLHLPLLLLLLHTSFYNSLFIFLFHLLFLEIN